MWFPSSSFFWRPSPSCFLYLSSAATTLSGGPCTYRDTFFFCFLDFWCSLYRHGACCWSPGFVMYFFGLSLGSSLFSMLLRPPFFDVRWCTSPGDFPALHLSWHGSYFLFVFASGGGVRSAGWTHLSFSPSWVFPGLFCFWFCFLSPS